MPALKTLRFVLDMAQISYNINIWVFLVHSWSVLLVASVKYVV